MYGTVYDLSTKNQTLWAPGGFCFSVCLSEGMTLINQQEVKMLYRTGLTKKVDNFMAITETVPITLRSIKNMLNC